MGAKDWVLRTVAVVVVLGLVNIGLFVMMSGSEHTLNPTQAVGTPIARSKLETRGLLYSRACNASPMARSEETAILLREASVKADEVVLIAPAGGALLADALFHHFDEETRMSLTLRIVDKGGEFAAAASKRYSPDLDLWLHHNRGAPHGPRERLQFLSEVHRILVPGGRLVMLDYAKDATSQKEMTFLEEIVAPNSYSGYRAHFLDEGEMVEMVEGAGFGGVECHHVEYSWAFASVRESLSYIHGVFGLDLMKETDVRLKRAVARYLESWVSAVDGSTHLNWQAVVVTAQKAAPWGVERVAVNPVIIDANAVIGFSDSAAAVFEASDSADEPDAESSLSDSFALPVANPFINGPPLDGMVVESSSDSEYVRGGKHWLQASTTTDEDSAVAWEAENEPGWLAADRLTAKVIYVEDLTVVADVESEEEETEVEWWRDLFEWQNEVILPEEVVAENKVPEDPFMVNIAEDASVADVREDAYMPGFVRGNAYVADRLTAEAINVEDLTVVADVESEEEETEVEWWRDLFEWQNEVILPREVVAENKVPEDPFMVNIAEDASVADARADAYVPGFVREYAHVAEDAYVGFVRDVAYLAEDTSGTKVDYVVEVAEVDDKIVEDVAVDTVNPVVGLAIGDAEDPLAEFSRRLQADKEKAERLQAEDAEIAFAIEERLLADAMAEEEQLQNLWAASTAEEYDEEWEGEEDEDEELWTDEDAIGEYIFQADATVDLSRLRRRSPSFAHCGSKPRMYPLLKEHLATSNHWRDVSSVLSTMLKARSASGLDPRWRVYCGKKSLDACFGSALFDSKSPLGSIHLLQCSSAHYLLKINRWVKAAGRTEFSRDLIVLDGGLGWQVGDKAGLFVSGMQAMDATHQATIYKHVPRTYLVAVPCAGVQNDDQWDFWLDDYFQHAPAEAAAFRKDWETRFTVPDETSTLWRQPQPAIDKGANMWISKPALSVYYDPLKGSGKPGRMHQGLDVDIIYSPQDFLDTIEEEDSLDHCVSKYRVLQKYVEQPILWDGYKADFRMYILTLSVDPPRHYLYTRQFPVRVGQVPYSEGRGVKFVSDIGQDGHVTNLSKAKRDGISDNMATWANYVEFLSKEFPGVDVEEHLFANIAEMVTSTLGAMKGAETLKSVATANLSGWDVILDKDLNLWLMEINRFPDWAVDLSAMSKFKFLLFSDMFNLVYNHDPWSDKVEQVGAFRLLE